MNRLYYGSVTCEVTVGSVTTITNIACITGAFSVDEARGWATRTALEKFPGGRVATVQMYQIPDETIKLAARILDGGVV